MAIVGKEQSHSKARECDCCEVFDLTRANWLAGANRACLTLSATRAGFSQGSNPFTPKSSASYTTAVAPPVFGTVIDYAPNSTSSIAQKVDNACTATQIQPNLAGSLAVYFSHCLKQLQRSACPIKDAEGCCG